MKQKKLHLMSLLALSLLLISGAGRSLQAQNVIKIHIEDLSKNYRETDDGISADPMISLNIKANGDVTIKGVKESYGPYASSYSLTGQDVEIIGDVTKLECKYTNISTLDCTACSSLVDLECGSSNITNLKVAGLKNLKSLESKYNKLTELDLSGCEALEELHINRNTPLTTITLVGCKSLAEFEGTHNDKLESLDFSTCPAIKKIECQGSIVGTINLKGCTKLEYLDCGKTKVKELSIAGLSSLDKVYCDKTEIASVDLTGCDALTVFSASGAKLSKLDLKGKSKLATLVADKNELTEINIEGCTSLRSITIFLNKLSAEMMDKFCQDLPSKKDLEGPFNLLAMGRGYDATEGNKMLKTSVEVAKGKNWTVLLKDVDNYSTSEYKGESQYYAVTIAASENGSISVLDYDTEALKKVEAGTVLTVKSTPADGYELVSLKAGNEDITSTLSFTVNSDVTLTATFGKKKPDTPIDDTKYLFSGVVNDDEAKGYRFSYDDKDRLTRIDYIVSGEIKAWDLIDNNEKGDIVSINKYLSFSAQEQPKLDTQFKYTYDDKGRVATRECVMLGNSLSLCTFKYDEQGRCTGYYDSKGRIGEYYEYDEKGNMIKLYQKSEDGAGGDGWKGRIMGYILYRYNAKNQLIEEEAFPDMLSNPDKPVSDHRIQYVYTPEGNLEHLDYDKRTTKGEWKRALTVGYKYDLAVPGANVHYPVFPMPADGPYTNNETKLFGLANKKTEELYFAPGNDSEPMIKKIYEYRFYNSVRETLQNTEVAVSVYPNPASDMLSVSGMDLQQVAIYSFDGTLYGSFNVQADRVDVPVYDLPRGNYIVTVQSAKGSSSTKVVLQ